MTAMVRCAVALELGLVHAVPMLVLTSDLMTGNGLGLAMVTTTSPVPPG